MAAEPAAQGVIRPGGLAVLLHGEEVWREMRAAAQVPDTFVNEGWCLDDMHHGGGKGGTLMAQVGSSFIVKELSSGDHQQLLALAGSYAEHVRGGESLLTPIYLHFSDAQTGRSFFVMRNTVGAGPVMELYDLKGCADDKTLVRDGEPIKVVHKRIWNVGMWCGRSSWSDERVKYHNGKMAARDYTVLLRKGEREKVVARVERDVEWLAEHGLMDYSLLVAVKAASSKGLDSNCEDLARRTFAKPGPDGTDLVVQISIIDFLQKWTAAKRVARIIKAAERNKATVPPGMYGERFRAHVASMIQGEEVRMKATAPKAVAPPAGDVG